MLVDKARDYMTKARAKRTRQAYSRAWAAFQSWCDREGRCALPADPATVAAWIAGPWPMAMVGARCCDRRCPRFNSPITQPGTPAIDRQEIGTDRTLAR
jgi:hypothetical protein